MPNTSQPSQRPTPGNYSGSNIVQNGEFVLFENKPELYESQTIPEVTPAYLTEPTPIRQLQNSLPLTKIGAEVPTAYSIERAIAVKARQAADVVLENRGTAVNQRWRELGFEDAA